MVLTFYVLIAEDIKQSTETFSLCNYYMLQGSYQPDGGGQGTPP